MSLNEDRMAPRSSAWRSVRLVTVTTAVVFAGLAIVNALAVGYAIAMARTLRRERREQVGTFGRILGEG